jgi:AcrR family transcriptional regulator
MTEVKPMRADARRNYERLLEEAQRAFAEHGVEASLEDIARRAGVGIGTLYRHFPTRDALLETLLRARFDAQAERARELLTHPEPLAALQTWLSGLSDESSRLYASCHEMREAGSHLVERAKNEGALREDVTTDELLLLLHAASWAGGHLPGPGGMHRLLALVFEGLRVS